MIDFDIISQFAQSLRFARRQIGLKQKDVAERIGVSRDMIVRMERGENVGIHHVLAAIHAVGLRLELVENAHVVAGSFDEFYQERFRKSLEAELHSNPAEASKRAAFVKPGDASRMRVINWKKAAKI